MYLHGLIFLTFYNPVFSFNQRNWRYSSIDYDDPIHSEISYEIREKVPTHDLFHVGGILEINCTDDEHLWFHNSTTLEFQLLNNWRHKLEPRHIGKYFCVNRSLELDNLNLTDGLPFVNISYMIPFSDDRCELKAKLTNRNAYNPNVAMFRSIDQTITLNVSLLTLDDCIYSGGIDTVDPAKPCSFAANITEIWDTICREVVDNNKYLFPMILRLSKSGNNPPHSKGIHHFMLIEPTDLNNTNGKIHASLKVKKVGGQTNCKLPPELNVLNSHCIRIDLYSIHKSVSFSWNAHDDIQMAPYFATQLFCTLGGTYTIYYMVIPQFIFSNNYQESVGRMFSMCTTLSESSDLFSYVLNILMPPLVNTISVMSKICRVGYNEYYPPSRNLGIGNLQIKFGLNYFESTKQEFRKKIVLPNKFNVTIDEQELCFSDKITPLITFIKRPPINTNIQWDKCVTSENTFGVINRPLLFRTITPERSVDVMLNGKNVGYGEIIYIQSNEFKLLIKKYAQLIMTAFCFGNTTTAPGNRHLYFNVTNLQWNNELTVKLLTTKAVLWQFQCFFETTVDCFYFDRDERVVDENRREKKKSFISVIFYVVSVFDTQREMEQRLSTQLGYQSFDKIPTKILYQKGSGCHEDRDNDDGMLGKAEFVKWQKYQVGQFCVTALSFTYFVTLPFHFDDTAVDAIYREIVSTSTASMATSMTSSSSTIDDDEVKMQIVITVLITSGILCLIFFVVCCFVVYCKHYILTKAIVERQEQLLHKALKNFENLQSYHKPVSQWAIDQLETENLVDSKAIAKTVKQPLTLILFSNKITKINVKQLDILVLPKAMYPNISIYKHNCLQTTDRSTSRRSSGIDITQLHITMMKDVTKHVVYVSMPPARSEMESYFAFVTELKMPILVVLNQETKLQNDQSPNKNKTNPEFVKRLVGKRSSTSWMNDKEFVGWGVRKIHETKTHYGQNIQININRNEESNVNGKTVPNPDITGKGLEIFKVTGWNEIYQPPMKKVVDLIRVVNNLKKTGDQVIIQCENGIEKSMIFVAALFAVEMLEEFKVVNIVQLVQHLRLMRYGCFPHKSIRQSTTCLLRIVAKYIRTYRQDLLLENQKDT